ncbi:MAG: helix-turn-helix domain-containing protein [[Clostridium] scindens]
MDTLNLAENLIRLRREKEVTQEEVASFIGVTKASVSKWETKQSLTDILLLPVLASYYGVTVDELLGYKPQLGKEQIQKIYHDLAAEFAEKPFEEVMDASRKLVKKYYSCYSFLLQISILWLNHYTFAEDPKSQMGILDETVELCTHIIENCKDISICNDATVLKAIMDLQRGRPQEALDLVEDMLSPYRLASQSSGILIQAYQMVGDMDKAVSYTQISMFLHLLSLVEGATQYIAFRAQDKESCEETIRRMDGLIELFQLERLHQNIAAVYHYQVAVYQCQQEDIEGVFARLKRFVEIICDLLDHEAALHGDGYFNRLEEWFEGLDLGKQMVRDKKLVLDNACQALENPVFSPLIEDKRLVRLKRVLTEKRETL